MHYEEETRSKMAVTGTLVQRATFVEMSNGACFLLAYTAAAAAATLLP